MVVTLVDGKQYKITFVELTPEPRDDTLHLSMILDTSSTEDIVQYVKQVDKDFTLQNLSSFKIIKDDKSLEEFSAKKDLTIEHTANDTSDFIIVHCSV